MKKRITAIIAIVVLTFSLPLDIDAAEVSIDASVTTTSTRYEKTARNIVCVDDTDCYAFYIDSTQDPAFQKSTDGGATWGGAGTAMIAGTHEGIAVWYDQWTPGDSGGIIHVVTFETASATVPDRLWYSRFDTSDDSFSTFVDASGAAEGVLAAANDVTITKGTDGDIYVGTVDATAPTAGANFIEKCANGNDCTTEGGWAAAGSNPWDGSAADADGVFSLTLLPLSDTAAHDSGDIMLISHDLTANVIEYKVYDDSADTWSTNFTSADSIIETVGFPHVMSGTVNPSSGDIYVSFVDSAGVANSSEVQVLKYDDAWSALTDPWPDTTDGASILSDAAIGVDTETGDLYVAYIRAATTVAVNDVYYAISSDDGASWNGEVLLSNGTDGDHRAVSIDALSSERLYAVWSDPTPDDMFGGLVADLTPPEPEEEPIVGRKIRLVAGTTKLLNGSRVILQ
jgi:hypothetical protein